MKRWVFVVAALIAILVAIYAFMLVAYGVGGAIQKWTWAADIFGAGNLSRLTNMIFLMLMFVMILATLLTLAERKWSAMMQDRIGPNRARIALPGIRNFSLSGVPHILADSVKMLTKEAFRPAKANRVLFNLGPILAFASVFALFAIVPAGPTVPV